MGHPHICALYDVGREPVRPGGATSAVAGEPLDFLVLERVDGETLSSRLLRGALPPAQALRLAIDIADALATAHRRGLIHRDLKPGNVMITKAGAKLLDFGLAKHVPPPAGIAPLQRRWQKRRRSRPKVRIQGTFQYMAPEQFEGAAGGRAHRHLCLWCGAVPDVGRA